MGRDADGPGYLFFLGTVNGDGIAVTLLCLPKLPGEILRMVMFIGIRNLVVEKRRLV